MGRGTAGDSLRTFQVKDARARNASPIKAIQALAQIPTPSFDTLPTAAISGAPIATRSQESRRRDPSPNRAGPDRNLVRPTRTPRGKRNRVPHQRSPTGPKGAA